MTKINPNTEWRNKNLEHVRAYDRLQYQKHKKVKKERVKKYYLENIEEKKKYAKKYAQEIATHRERKQREELAGRPRPELCEVCGGAERICFDHDHATGKFRGWICTHCNLILGHSRDRTEVLQKLIKYLINNNQQ